MGLSKEATMHDMAEQAAKAQRLMAVGIPGTATLVALRDTGVAYNDHREVELDLQVAAGGGAPYAVAHRQVIDRLAVAGLQPGATLPVRVDPENPQSVMVG